MFQVETPEGVDRRTFLKNAARFGAVAASASASLGAIREAHSATTPAPPLNVLVWC